MGKNTSPPPTPDYVGAAEMTAESALELADYNTRANRVNQYTPWGSTTWHENGNGTWNQTVTLPSGEGSLGQAYNAQAKLIADRSIFASDMAERAGNILTAPIYFDQEHGVPAWHDVGVRTESSPLALQNLNMEGLQGRPLSQYSTAPGQVRADLDKWGGNAAPVHAKEIGSRVDDIQNHIAAVAAPQMTGAPTNWMQQVGAAGSPQMSLADRGMMQQYSPEQIQRGVNVAPAENRQNTDQIRQNAEDAIYQRSTSRLDPQWQQRQSDMEASLRAKGMRPGDAAFDREMENFNRARIDAYQTATNEAIMGGGAEAQRQFGMQRDARQQDLDMLFNQGQFANSASNQALQQQFGIGDRAFDQGSQRFNQGMMLHDAGYQEALGRANFYNQASQNRFNMGMQAREQGVNEAALRAGFYNQSQGQKFSQEQQSANQNFNQGMMAQNNQFDQAQARANFFNQAQQQDFNQRLAGNQQLSSQRAQSFQELTGQQQYNNQIRQQNWQSQDSQYQNKFANDMQRSAFMNNLRTQMINQELQNRGYTLNEIQALIQGQQVNMPQMPGYMSATAAPGVDYMGAAQSQYAADLNSYNAQQAGSQGFMSGIGGLALGIGSLI